MRAGSPPLGPLPARITAAQLWNNGTTRRHKRIPHALRLTVRLFGTFDVGLFPHRGLTAAVIRAPVGVRWSEPCETRGLQVVRRRLSGLLILNLKGREHCGGNQAGGDHGVSPLTSPTTPGATLAEQAAAGNAPPNRSSG